MTKISTPSEEHGEREKLVTDHVRVDNESPYGKPRIPKWGFCFLGVVGLLCYNFFLQVIGFLAQATRPSFVSASTAVYGISNNVGQLACIFLGAYVSMSKRVTISCILIVLVSVGYPLIVNSNWSFGFQASLCLAGFLGLGNAIFQSAGFGLAAWVGLEAMNYMSFGQSLAGILVAGSMGFVNVLLSRTRDTSATADMSEQRNWSLIIGFAIVGLVTIATIPFFVLKFSKEDAVREALQARQYAPRASGETDLAQRSIPRIISATFPLAFMVWLVLFVTFVVFPGLVLSWEPTRTRFVDSRGDYGQLMIIIFQIFDAVGKFLAILGVKLSPLLIKILSPLRVSLIVFFLASGAKILWLGDDFARMALVAVLATTNGLLITWCMIWGPRQVRESEAEISGYTMSFFLVFGISCGSLVSYMLTATSTVTEDLTAGAAEMRSLVQAPEGELVRFDLAEFLSSRAPQTTAPIYKAPN
jgi:hypothetical protein